MGGSVNNVTDLVVEDLDGRAVVTYNFSNNNNPEASVTGSGIWELNEAGTSMIGCYILDEKFGGAEVGEFEWSAAKPEDDTRRQLQEMRWMRDDMDRIRKDPNPRGGKRVGDDTYYEVSLGLPLGIALDDHPTKKFMVGVSEVLDEGSAGKHNAIHMTNADKATQQFWIQSGDRLRAVNGSEIKTKEDAVEKITGAKDSDKIVLTFSRERRGFIKVCFPERDVDFTLPRDSSLIGVAKAAGLDFTCDSEDCDGSCWHVNDMSGEVYPMCQFSTLAQVPSKIDPDEGLIPIKFGFDPSAETDPLEKEQDNTQPIVLRRCPELYQASMEQAKRMGM